MITLLCTLLVSCGEPEPLKIGLLGSLSGRASEVSQAVRDGALIAVEEINATGGLDGRQVELVIFDDQHDSVKAKEGVNVLADAGVVAIIGPVTSQMAVAAAPEAETRKTVLISPTSSTVELSGKKDHFYRTIPTCIANARSLAKHAVQTLGTHKFAILSDQSNSAFTDPWRENFTEQLKLLGGTVVTKTDYNSLQNSTSFLELAKEILALEPEGILILANSIDTAIFCQQIRKLAEHKILMGSDWAFSGDLVQYGGSSVEGFTFTTNLDMENSAPQFKKFQEKFEQRFGIAPNFPSVYAFEAAQIIFKALTKDPDSSHLSETLVSLGKIGGLQDTILFDPFGDVKRSVFINKVKDGRFVSVLKVD